MSLSFVCIPALLCAATGIRKICVPFLSLSSRLLPVASGKWGSVFLAASRFCLLLPSGSSPSAAVVPFSWLVVGVSPGTLHCRVASKHLSTCQLSRQIKNIGHFVGHSKHAAPSSLPTIVASNAKIWSWHLSAHQLEHHSCKCHIHSRDCRSFGQMCIMNLVGSLLGDSLGQ